MDVNSLNTWSEKFYKGYELNKSTIKCLCVYVHWLRDADMMERAKITFKCSKKSVLLKELTTTPLETIDLKVNISKRKGLKEIRESLGID